MRYIIALASLTVCLSAHAQVAYDADGRTLSDGVVTLRFPEVGAPCEVAILRDGQVLSSRHWYYIVAGDMQAGKMPFRSSGAVVSVTAVEAGPERATVRVVCLTDDPDDPERGTFTLDYAVQAGHGAIRHEMTFVPREPVSVRSYDFFMATDQVAGDTHRLHYFERGTELGVMPAANKAPYGRIPVPHHLAWVGLETVATGGLLSVGVPAADVRAVRYCVDFKRFEVSWSGGRVTASAPLHDFALMSVGDDPQALADLHREFVASVDRPEREAEPTLPTPDLTRRPEALFTPCVTRQVGGYAVASGDVKLLVGSDGAVEQVATPAGDTLAQPGGIVFVEWPERTVTGPGGAVTGMRAEGDSLRWDWAAADLSAHHDLRAREGCVEWTARVENLSDRPRLIEVRLALPVAMGEGRWSSWDGMKLSRVDTQDTDDEMTILEPGGIASQGIFPAVCLHNERAGLAMGMTPMHIESFYGSRLAPAAGGPETWYYAVRWALPPGGQRTARFVVYATDPQWSWRSAVQRYWSLWPEVFAAPERDDIWGLYSAASPNAIHNQGDTFIERCRRLRVGGMELYAPFNRTGDFYPDDDPVYVRTRGDVSLTREQVRAAQQTANIASCNISYVIPTKCERELAKSTFADSIIRCLDGSMFLLDHWDVMGGKTEKLAGMNALGNSYQESLHREVMQIVDNYAPDGFYFDNGAFVWQDYGREGEWAAFDDDGNVFTNAGIAYAVLQDMLAERAPQIHRNPGEHIQYFSGFRGQSHLSNNTGGQRYYVRSHRLIMGYKPIFPGHPRNIVARSTLYDYLEFGGLPWLVGMRTQGERLAQAWAPVAIALARAGWHPVTDAVTDRSDVRVQRFGDGAPTMFTVRNLFEGPASASVTILGEYPTLADLFGRVDLAPQVADGMTRLTVELDAGAMLFLTTDPPTPRTEPWPEADLLATAAPVSIVVSPDASDAERRMARRVKGFVELQAELLGGEAVVEVVEGVAAAAHPARVVIAGGTDAADLQGDGDTLTLSFGDEEEGRRLLSAYLDTIAVPLSDEPATWVP